MTYTNIVSFVGRGEAKTRSPRARASLLQRGLHLFNVWRKRMRDRTALARMSEAGLRDIGADQATAELEARRFFWQAYLPNWDRAAKARH